MFERLLTKILAVCTGRSYDGIGFEDLRYVFDKGAGSFLRGFAWSILHLRRPCGLLLGRHVKFVSAGRLKLGRGVSLGHGSYIECSAARGVTLEDRVTIREYGWLQCRSGLGSQGVEVRIERGVYIGPFAVLGAGGPLIISRGCQLGARVTISAESHTAADGSYVDGNVTRQGVFIGQECWIGNNVCILDGVRIGDRCVIGAGSVVTRDIPDNSMAYGVPARVKKGIGGAVPK